MSRKVDTFFLLEEWRNRTRVVNMEGKSDMVKVNAGGRRIRWSAGHGAWQIANGKRRYSVAGLTVLLMALETLPAGKAVGK